MPEVSLRSPDMVEIQQKSLLMTHSKLALIVALGIRQAGCKLDLHACEICEKFLVGIVRYLHEGLTFICYFIIFKFYDLNVVEILISYC